MAGSTPRKAVQNFLKPLQLALSCVSDAQVAMFGDYATTVEVGWLIPDEPVLLPRARGALLRARLNQKFRIVRAEGQRGPWKVTITAYHYTLEESDGRGDAADVGRAELQGAHIPTGRVALEQALRFAIETFKVRPRRSDWRDVLFGTRRRFEQWRTWE